MSDKVALHQHINGISDRALKYSITITIQLMAMNFTNDDQLGPEGQSSTVCKKEVPNKETVLKEPASMPRSTVPRVTIIEKQVRN